MMTNNKIIVICELMQSLSEDSTGGVLKDHLKMIGYAPSLGYLSWIFKYKGVHVLLSDLGNGNYEYICPLSKFDVLIARIYERLYRLSYNYERPNRV